MELLGLANLCWVNIPWLSSSTSVGPWGSSEKSVSMYLNTLIPPSVSSTASALNGTSVSLHCLALSITFKIVSNLLEGRKYNQT